MTLITFRGQPAVSQTFHKIWPYNFAIVLLGNETFEKTLKPNGGRMIIAAENETDPTHLAKEIEVAFNSPSKKFRETKNA